MEIKTFKKELELIIAEMEHHPFRLLLYRKYRAIYEAYKKSFALMQGDKKAERIHSDIVSYLDESKQKTNEQRVNNRYIKRYLNPKNLDELDLNFWIWEQQATEDILLRFDLFFLSV